jgi:predicted RNA binding protein YcfA (HicA-like mRNA interferase family)
MPGLKPVSRRELVRKLKAMGFDGPFPGGKHELTIPNPHAGAIDPGLIRRILRQAGITLDEWLSA